MTDTEIIARLALWWNDGKASLEKLWLRREEHWTCPAYGPWNPLCDREAAAMVLEEVQRRGLLEDWLIEIMPYQASHTHWPTSRVLDVLLMPPRQQMEAVLKVLKEKNDDD